VTTEPNPFDTALNATAEMPPLYGEFVLDAFFGVLEKGIGKVVYNPQQHSPAQRRTIIKVGIIPLVETKLQFALEREFIAEFPKDGWLKVTLPSLHALNVKDLKALHGQYVKAESVTYGTYTKQGTDDVRDLTAPKVTAIYGSREECLEAYYAETGAERIDTSIPGFDDINEQLGLPTDPPPAAADDNGSGSKKTALAFLPAIVRSCRQPDNSIDLEMLADKLATTPLLKEHFTVTSQEVITEVEKALAEPAF
jgi:hypothetical protein